MMMLFDLMSYIYIYKLIEIVEGQVTKRLGLALFIQ